MKKVLTISVLTLLFPHQKMKKIVPSCILFILHILFLLNVLIQ